MAESRQRDPAAAEARYLVGLVGAGIGASLSPALHEREAEQHGLRYLYQLIDTDRLGLGADGVGALLGQARRLGYRGLNVTHPCKQEVVRHLDDLSPEAAAVDAVNTVVFEGGRAVGHNTDGVGFRQSFARRLPDVAIDGVVVLGAGGAGAAVASAVLDLGAGRVSLVDPDHARAVRLTGALRARFGPARAACAEVRDLPGTLSAADGLINASPVGMTGHPGIPLPVELLRPELWVADVVYRPLRTELLRRAHGAGCRTLDGGGMLVFQAAAAFRIFTGREPDADRMFRHLASLTREEE
jgi:quinate/shikimate dehydrogenase (NAD+)